MHPQQADARVQQVAKDFRVAELADADLAMLDYAVKLTQQPAEIEAADIDSLRDAGWDDRAIHDLCAIVGYFAFANRIANGLGIELEKA